MLQTPPRARAASTPALLLTASVCTALLCVAYPASAASVIKRPGLHPSYSVELEPHLVFGWAEPLWHEDSWGPGLRLGIPIVEDGPIPKVNNSMAISFGLDWTMSEIAWPFCYGTRSSLRGRECEANALWFPVALQWNFWLTDIISVFGEPGLAFRYAWWDVDDCFDAECDGNDTHVQPVFWGGGRFVFTDNFGLVVRLGLPSVSVGATFLL